jgi:hypothetical protein
MNIFIINFKRIQEAHTVSSCCYDGNSTVMSLPSGIDRSSGGQGMHHFYGTRRLITAFTKANYWIVSWVS